MKEDGRTARAYLASRGLDSDELIDHFQIGFADRTLGLRMPDKNRKEGRTVALAADAAWPVAGERPRAL